MVRIMFDVVTVLCYLSIMSNRDHKVERAVHEIVGFGKDDSAEVRVFTIDGQDGSYRDFPEKLDSAVAGVYGKKGITSLYSHQGEAIEKVLDGNNVVVATPTASGKTLVYNSLAIDALSKDPSAKSLYLFPTKALAQDQLSELFEINKLMGDKLGLFTYDGDTPQSARKAIRKKAQIVISNPYMIHSGILPHHTKWVNLFENLQYVIIDELHYYTGVFGSHMGNIIRRLKRICRFYGSNPKFIMSSATIANPGELAEKIIEEKVEVVEKSGAPTGNKYIVFYNPPVVNRQLGIRRSYVSLARHLSGILLKNNLQIITFANARLTTEVLVKYLKNDFEKKVTDQGIIRGYRGGYLPAKRREIEKDMRAGKIRGIVSTNALELGVDIGELDGVVLAGYPGTVASTWQRLGRAGRRGSSAVGILVANSSPVNQFIASHPEYFSGKSPEHGRINPDNLSILVDHIKCASFELPFTMEESFGGEDLEEILDFLAEGQMLLKRNGKWLWTDEGYPADAVSINRVSSDNFVVVDRTEGEKIIAEVDFASALETLHHKAIYMLEGEQYVVEEFDYENRKAFVRLSTSDYYTDAITYTKIAVLDRYDDAYDAWCTYGHGDVHVFSQVIGFKKLKFFTNENVGSGDLQLPQQEMHTTAFWIHLKSELHEELMQDLSAEEIIEGIWGVARLMRHIGAVTLMCDVKDIHVTVEDNASGEQLKPGKAGAAQGITGFTGEFEPVIYIYDGYPGGVGLAESLYEKRSGIFESVLEVLEQCSCKSGCPSCVGPGAKIDSNHRKVAAYMLKKLTGRLMN